MSPSSLATVAGALPATISCSGTKMHCASDKVCDKVRKPTFCLEFFKIQVRNGNWGVFNSNRIEKNLDKLGWDYKHLKEFLLGIKGGFQHTVDDCTVNDLDGYDKVVADQYEVHWDEEKRVARQQMCRETIALSVKITVISDAVGILSGAVTFHTSGIA